MGGVAIIVFREVLEAALVVTVVLAAARGLKGRGLWVSLGITGGVLGAMIVAALANVISNSFAGTGQEITNAAILFLAVALICWHVIWMNSHGKQMAKDLRQAALRVHDGSRHIWTLALVVGLAVMREGSEVVLMLQGFWAGGQTSLMLGGGLLGLALGIAFGAMIYVGFVALSVTRLFALTNFILVLIAAGMAARAANFLSQADLLPSLGDRIWDTSFILSDESVVGRAFGAMVGYIAEPSGLELLFYGLTVMGVFAIMRATEIVHTRHVVSPVKMG